MTKGDIVFEIGRNLNLVNESRSAWFDDRGLKEIDIESQCDIIFRNKIFPKLAAKAAWAFEMTAKLNSYIFSETVDATTSGTTLVIESSLFDQSVVGLTIYNETDDTSTTIEEYVSQTTVVVADDVSDWGGDTIYLCGKYYIFNGDADDLYNLKSVYLSYSSSSDKIQATKRMKSDLLKRGTETFSSLDPKYALTSMKDIDDPRKYYWGVEIFPKFESITGEIEITYTERPPTISSTDSYNFPVDDVIIKYATSWGFLKLGDKESAGVWKQEGKEAESEFFSFWNPARNAITGPVRSSESSFNIRTRRR